MNGPPDAKKAAPGRAALNDLQDEVEIQCIADEAATVNDVGGVIWHVDVEHRRAPKALLDRFYAAVTPDQTGTFLPHLARVRFETHRFDFDPEAEWAVVAPIFEERQIVNWAAFAVDDDTLRRTFLLGHFAVGLEDAEWDARVHPLRRLLVHFSVWAWLKSGGAGVLPVDWARTALYIKGEGYGREGLTNEDAVEAGRALDEALALTPMYSREGEEP